MIAIIDYDAGNIRSVEKALFALGEQPVVTRKKEEILAADKLILPGVGAFGDAMERLHQYGLVDVIREALNDKGIPILGICRGHQVLNFALGGTLWQDIYTSPGTNLSHQQSSARHELHHQLLIQQDSLLSDILGVEKMHTNSFHHQAVRDPAPGLKVSARTADGIVEAIESDDSEVFVLGIQFHPECLYKHHPRFLRIFSRFVQAAAHNPNVSAVPSEKEFLL